MEHLKILNKKESKRILSKIENQWGTSLEREGKGDYVFLLSDKQKVYLATREVFDLDLSRIRVNSYGIYFAEIKSGIRLSIEGSQLIGPKATKNVVELDDKELKEWMRGEDLHKETGCKEFVIITHKGDFLGTGKALPDKILNYVPKTRRVRL